MHSNYAAHLQISAEILHMTVFKSLRVADFELTPVSLFVLFFFAVVRSPLWAEHHHRGRCSGGAAALQDGRLDCPGHHGLLSAGGQHTVGQPSHRCL